MSISIQKKILGTSRVNILYELEDNGSIIKQLIPYVIGVIGDIAGSQNIDEYYKRKFINIHKENFNDIFASIKPKCKIKFKIDQEKQQDLEFLSIKDFEPSSIIQKIPDLKNLEDKRLVLDDLLTRIMNNEEVNKILLNTFGKKNIDDFIKNINLFTVEEQKDLLINEIKNLIAKEKIEIKTSKDLQELLAGKIKNIQDTFNSCIS